jgi:hypothetical protein
MYNKNHLGYVGHKEKFNVCGRLELNKSGEMVLYRTKYLNGREINAEPKVVGDDIWKSFDLITHIECSVREVLDLNNSSK